jgi:putative ATP-binding cassette transporter
LGRPLIGLNYRQSDQEATFRSDLIHVRENGDSIALLQHEDVLATRLLRRIDSLAENFRRIISVNRNLGFFTTGYNNLIQLIPALIVAPLFIRGKAEFGVITQSAVAFAQLLGAFSLIVNQFQSISSFAAVIARLSSLAGAVDKRSLSPEMVVVGDDGHIAYKGLTLLSPDRNRELLKNLNVEIPHGTRLLVVGPNEDARIALFRATAGVWPAVVGTVRRPPLEDIFFLSQRPYLPPGTLRDLLVRSGQEQAISDDQIATILRDVGLGSIHVRAGGLDAEQDWSAILSLGEQQLLALTRLIIARPAFIMLDRAMASLKPAQVREALRCLNENSVTYIAFAEEVESVDLYDAVLEINSGGGWEWTPVSRAA